MSNSICKPDAFFGTLYITLNHYVHASHQLIHLPPVQLLLQSAVIALSTWAQVYQRYTKEAFYSIECKWTFVSIGYGIWMNRGILFLAIYVVLLGYNLWPNLTKPITDC